MDWQAAATFVRERCEIIRDQPNMLGARIPVHVEHVDILQDIGFSEAVVHGQAWLAVIAPVCPQGWLSAAEALVQQDLSAFGALVVRQGGYLLRHGVLLRPLGPDVLQWTIGTIAHEAVRIRASVRTRSAADASVALFGE